MLRDASYSVLQLFLSPQQNAQHTALQLARAQGYSQTLASQQRHRPAARGISISSPPRLSSQHQAPCEADSRPVHRFLSRFDCSLLGQSSLSTERAYSRGHVQHENSLQ